MIQTKHFFLSSGNDKDNDDDVDDDDDDAGEKMFLKGVKILWKIAMCCSWNVLTNNWDEANWKLASKIEKNYSNLQTLPFH